MVNRKIEKTNKKKQNGSLVPPTSNQNSGLVTTHPPSLCWASKRPKRVRPLDTPKRSTLMAGWKIGHFGPPMHSPSIQDVSGIVPLEAKWFPPNPIVSDVNPQRCLSNYQGHDSWCNEAKVRHEDLRSWEPAEGGCLSHHFQGLIHINAGFGFPLTVIKTFEHMCFIWRPINLPPGIFHCMEGNDSHTLFIWSSKNTIE